MVSAPFAEFTWRHARHLAAETGIDDTNETEIARVLDDRSGIVSDKTR